MLPPEVDLRTSHESQLVLKYIGELEQKLPNDLAQLSTEVKLDDRSKRPLQRGLNGGGLTKEDITQEVEKAGPPLRQEDDDRRKAKREKRQVLYTSRQGKEGSRCSPARQDDQ